MSNRMTFTMTALSVAAGIWVAAADLQPSRETPPAAGKIHLTMRIGGGYVYAFAADGKSVVLGTMDMVKHQPSTVHHHPHTMFLRQDKGTVDTKVSVPQVKTPAKTAAWDLTGYEIAIQPDGHEQRDHALTAPKSVQPADPCARPTQPAQINNWFYVPDLLHLVPGAKAGNAAAEMVTRIPISRGTLAVNKLVPGCFEFKDKEGTGKVQGRQLTVHGTEGVVYTDDETANYVDFVLTPFAGGQAKRIRLRPDSAGAIALRLSTASLASVEPDKPMTFFHAYYDLLVRPNGLALDKQSHAIPTWKAGVVKVTPGGECPPVSIGTPQ